MYVIFLYNYYNASFHLYYANLVLICECCERFFVKRSEFE